MVAMLFVQTNSTKEKVKETNMLRKLMGAYGEVNELLRSHQKKTIRKLIADFDFTSFRGAHSHIRRSMQLERGDYRMSMPLIHPT